MIELSGLDPERDIDVEIVGRRAGEKLHEELFNGYERALPTRGEKIMLAEREPLAPGAVEAMFAEIGLLVLEGDAAGLAAKVAELSAVRVEARGDRCRGEPVRTRCARGACAPHTLPGFMTPAPLALSLSSSVHGGRRDRWRSRRCWGSRSCRCSCSPRRASSSACASGPAAPRARRRTGAARQRRAAARLQQPRGRTAAAAPAPARRASSRAGARR